MNKHTSTKLLIFDDIARNGREIGDRIPTESELSKVSGFSRITIRHALRELKEKGIIESIQGKGTFLRKTLSKNKKSMGFVNFLAINDTTQGFDGVMYEELKRRGYQLKYAVTGEKPDSHVINEVKNSSGIIACGFITSIWTDFFKSLDIPVVVVGSNPTAEITTVKYDWKKGVKLLMEYFIKKGFRKIGLINASKNYVPASEIYNAYVDELEKNKIPLEDKRIIWGGRENTYFELDGYCENNKDFEAVIVETGCVFPLFVYLKEKNPSLQNLEIGTFLKDDFDFTSGNLEKFKIIRFEKSLFEEAVSVLFQKHNKNNSIVAIEPKLFCNGI